MRTRRVAAASVFLAVALTAQPPAAPPRPPETIFRSTTRVVEVSVIVRTKGRPLDDLSAHDFKLLDRGKPQRIAFFSLQRSQVAAKGQPLPPGLYSNQVNAQGDAPATVTLVLLDGLNTRWSDQVVVKKQIVRFLQTLQPRDRVAVFTLGQQVRVLFDFTSDFERLQQALARYRGENLATLEAGHPEPADTGIQQIDEFINEGNLVMADSANERRMKLTAAALEGIARYLGRTPGRKNLIWVSGSFPLRIGDFARSARTISVRGVQSFHRELERTARALNNANIAVYPVDARGLIGLPVNASSPDVSGLGRLGPAPSSPEIETMQKLAADTGGKAFYNTNGITEAIREAIGDAEVTYNLAFYPEELDGNYHQLAVDVARKGVEVRHRLGYYATPESEGGGSPDDVIRAVVAHPLDATGIGLAGGAIRVGGDWLVRFYADSTKVGIQKRDGRWKAAVDLLVAQLAGNGKVLNAESQVLSLNLTDRDFQKFREQVQRDGLLFEQRLKPDKEAAQLRLVLYDRLTGQVGSLRIPAPKAATP